MGRRLRYITPATITATPHDSEESVHQYTCCLQSSFEYYYNPQYDVVVFIYYYTSLPPSGINRISHQRNLREMVSVEVLVIGGIRGPLSESVNKINHCHHPGESPTDG